jgi:PAS domain S-box-containing protein
LTGVYDLRLVALSIVIDPIAAYSSLDLAGRLKSASRGREARAKLLCGNCGAISNRICAIRSMSMASAIFFPMPLAAVRIVHMVSISTFGLAWIAIAALLILALVLAALKVNRQTSLNALALARSQSELQTVFDAMTESLVILDSQLQLVRINRAAVRLLGVASASLSIESSRETVEILTLDGKSIPTQDWPASRGLRGDFCKNQEIVIRRRDTGVSFFAEVSTNPIPNLFGDARQVMCTFRDITERKQMDAARTLAAAIVDSSEDAIIGSDVFRRVTSWNKGAEKVFGYTSAEMIGQSLNLLLAPEQRQEDDDIQVRIMNGETVEQLELVRVRKNGELVQVSVTISPIKDAWGAIVGSSAIARNITATRKIERQLHQSQKMDAVGQLTGGISHDFNNLLGVIIGNLDLLERLIAGNEPALKRLHTARMAANRGADLTRRLLSFSSADELNPAPMLLRHAIHNVLELAARAVGPAIKMTTQLDPKLTLVFADAASFESALLNLIVNARDAMPNGGSLTIATQRSDVQDAYPQQHGGELPIGQYVCISVSDTGHGMPRDVLERAFEPFFTTKPRTKGTGLGLAMAYGFAKQSGGTARIYSEVGHGTTVSIYLPLVAGDLTSATIPETQRIFAPHGGTALVVDDEPDLLEIAVMYLTDLGYDALHARDGNSALALIEQRSNIVLMVTDIIMGGNINGAELARKARKLNPKLRIVYSSGFPAGALEERSMELVEGPLLRKPYEFSQFSATIAAVMAANTQL